MSDEICFQNYNLEWGGNSEMKITRMIHSHTKKTSSIMDVLSLVVSFPETNVGSVHG